MAIYLLALLIGIVAGLRAMTAPAAVSWAAHLGYLNLEGTWLAFLGYAWTPYILSLAAIGEMIADQLPSTPSRKMPGPFGARIVSGALCGAALGIPAGVWIGGLIAGAVGAVLGTLGGYLFRMRLAAAFGKDRPAALIEDAIAIIAAILIVRAV
ncbi:DUF4126 domain-containing protein [Phyllobacterium salinisoli]|uniref:DUF4126 domain-containing protein n=1 Tax=Phyllobacterium salinisoli TaxID=1899321 RepID=A0A368K410_9HYPH|nr:DUF4126 domain-containing protein [Phyllobacterium salinisoli]RCS23213.1 DUF4126 domain-containing protein [Phyllobacterium salinisoli]